MQITVKNLQQQAFKVEVDDEETVLDFKKKIEALKGSEYAVSCQKLIYSGKILADKEKVSFYGIVENGYVVVMSMKQKPAPVIAAPETKKPEPQNVRNEEQSTSPNALPDGNKVFEYFVFHPEIQKAILRIRQNPGDLTVVLNEIRESNPQLFEFVKLHQERLMQVINGQVITSNLDELFKSLPQFQEFIKCLNQRTIIPILNELREAHPQFFHFILLNSKQIGDLIGIPITIVTSSSNQFEVFKALPQVQELRRAHYLYPGLFTEVSSKFLKDNINLAGIIAQNVEQFKQFVKDPTGLPEKKVVDRLVELGFDERLCKEAYLACGGNEEFAANYLLQQQFEQ